MGMARSIDMLGAHNELGPYRPGESAVHADARAFARDLVAIAADFRAAADELEAEEAA